MQLELGSYVYCCHVSAQFSQQGLVYNSIQCLKSRVYIEEGMQLPYLLYNYRSSSVLQKSNIFRAHAILKIVTLANFDGSTSCMPSST